LDIDSDVGKADYLKHLTPPEQKHLVMIRTVLVTPTRLVIGPPQQEPSNSVTRRYKDKLDAIIRVQFSDEEDRLFVSVLAVLSRREIQLMPF
jgi:RNA-dependent RNA polymerase